MRSGGAAVGSLAMLFSLVAWGQSRPRVQDLPRDGSSSPAVAVVVPTTPADMPPNPPRVSCDTQNLTISAKNSTLSSVLIAIKSCIGADIEMPQGKEGQDRVFSELGPAPIRTVLTEFLSSTDFNYVFSASADDPQKIGTVVLIARGESAGKVDRDLDAASISGSASSTRRAWQEARQNYLQSINPNQDDNQNAESAPQPAETATAAENTPVTPPPDASSSPITPVTTTPVPTTQLASASPAAASEGKSTQQMIQDMRQLFEQRKQMIQQQTSSPSH